MNEVEKMHLANAKKFSLAQQRHAGFMLNRQEISHEESISLACDLIEATQVIDQLVDKVEKLSSPTSSDRIDWRAIQEEEREKEAKWRNRR